MNQRNTRKNVNNMQVLRSLDGSRNSGKHIAKLLGKKLKLLDLI
jgi:hypothetical protein